jgi:hypothetical protein
MKKLFFIASLLFLASLYCFGQPEQQWFIVRGLGKTGWKQIGNDYYNEYGIGNTIGQAFTLSGIAHPIRNSNPIREKNDLFVIYSDGQYYNSRSAPGAVFTVQNDPFYPRHQSQLLSQTSHNLQTIHSSAIQYLYLTNIYEGDDPPDLVKAISGNQGLNSRPYTFGITPSVPRMTASHDVTRYSDITLIIPGAAVQNGDQLTFNQTRLISAQSTIQTNVFFEGSPIFNNGTEFCNTPIVDNGNGTITFTNVNAVNTPFIFVNLRPTINLPRYYETNPALNSLAIFNLIEMKEGHYYGTRTSLSENIVGSHDPNFIKLQSVCTHPEVAGYYFVFYHVQFQNDGRKPANNLSFEFSLPNNLNPDCLSVKTWSAGGKKVTGTLRATGKKPIGLDNMNQTDNVITKEKKIKIIFDFEETATVQPYQKYDPEPSIGYVDFCLKIKGNRPQEDRGDNYELINPTVYFGQDPYPVHEFYHTKTNVNPYGDDPPLPETIFQCKCNCRRP